LLADGERWDEQREVLGVVMACDLRRAKETGKRVRGVKSLGEGEWVCFGESSKKAWALARESERVRDQRENEKV
jgi:hypothetical protein